jgi:hypothetical protein
MAPCFASCTDESETWKTEKGYAKDLSERFGTTELKATDLGGANPMSIKAPMFPIHDVSERIFAAGLQKLSVQLEVKQACTATRDRA